MILINSTQRGTARAGGRLLCIGAAGLAGTLVLIEEKKEALLKRFSLGFLDSCRSLEGLLFAPVFAGEEGETLRGIEEGSLQETEEKSLKGTEEKSLKEGEVGARSEVTLSIRGASFLVEAGILCGEGGVLSALWELLEPSGAGFLGDLRQIPIRGETVEICEALGCNPYYLYSQGCALLCTQDERPLQRFCQQEGIPCACIGEVREKAPRLLYNQGKGRYLTRPERDELRRVLA